MRMARVLLRPMLRGVPWRRMSLVMLLHVVWGVGRIGWIGGARGGDVWIYRYLAVRLDVLRMVMVILVSILQGH